LLNHVHFLPRLTCLRTRNSRQIANAAELQPTLSQIIVS